MEFEYVRERNLTSNEHIDDRILLVVQIVHNKIIIRPKL